MYYGEEHYKFHWICILKIFDMLSTCTCMPLGCFNTPSVRIMSRGDRLKSCWIFDCIGAVDEPLTYGEICCSGDELSNNFSSMYICLYIRVCATKSFQIMFSLFQLCFTNLIVLRKSWMQEAFLLIPVRTAGSPLHWKIKIAYNLGLIFRLNDQDNTLWSQLYDQETELD